jgi:hypothetical protein
LAAQLMKNQRVRAATANVSVIDSTPILNESAKVPMPGDESTLLDASAVTASVTGQTYVINSVVHALKGLDVGGSLPIILKQLSEPELTALLRHLRECARAGLRCGGVRWGYAAAPLRSATIARAQWAWTRG